MTPRRRMNSTAASWLVSSTRITLSAGSPAFTKPSRNAPATAMFDEIAPDDPRRKAAFPDFMHNPAASLVTLGRFS